MDQRKLMDNANTITDMAKTQNTVYEIVSDMSSRQDALEERIQSLEEKIQLVQVRRAELKLHCPNQFWDIHVKDA